MKYLLPILLCLSLAPLCSAQPAIAYGRPDELKGVTKIFIDAGTDMEVRENIIKEIEKSRKKLPDLTIADRAEDAEVILSFGSRSRTYISGVDTTATSGTTASSTPTYGSTVTGDGVVVKPLGNNRVRLLMSFNDTRRNRIFERRPSTNFAREFIRAYLKANGGKN